MLFEIDLKEEDHVAKSKVIKSMVADPEQFSFILQTAAGSKQFDELIHKLMRIASVQFHQEMQQKIVSLFVRQFQSTKFSLSLVSLLDLSWAKFHFFVAYSRFR